MKKIHILILTLAMFSIIPINVYSASSKNTGETTEKAEDPKEKQNRENGITDTHPYPERNLGMYSNDELYEYLKKAKDAKDTDGTTYIQDELNRRAIQQLISRIQELKALGVKELSTLRVPADIASFTKESENIIATLDYISEHLDIEDNEQKEKIQSKLNNAIQRAQEVKVGDPVRAMSGEYVQNEEDFSVIRISRSYYSQNAVTGSFGYGWTSNADERILYGVDAAARQREKDHKKYLDNIIEEKNNLENLIKRDFKVSSLESAEKEINEELEKAKKTEQIFKDAADTCNSIHGYADELETEVKENLENVQKIIAEYSRILEILPEEKEKLKKLQDLYISEKRVWEEYVRIADECERLESLHAPSKFHGTPDHQYQVGIGKMVFIDENGTPHVFVLEAGNEYIPESKSEYEIKKLIRNNDNTEVLFKNGTVKKFHINGLLYEVSDRNGNTTSIARDGNGRILSISNKYGEKLLFTYNNERISTIVNSRDPEEKTVYRYEGNKLVEVTDRDGDTTRFEYNAISGKTVLTRLIKPDDRSILITYGDEESDGNILATKTTNENGDSETFVYDRDNNRNIYIDHSGNVTYTYYNEKHQTEREEHPVEKTFTEYTYYDDGNVKTENRNGNIVTYLYDALGNKTKIIYSDGSSDSFTYNEYGLVTSYTDRAGYSKYWKYDSRGNQTEYKNGNTVVSSAEYYPDGKLKSSRTNGGQILESYYYYDANGNLSEVRQSDKVQVLKYDSRNRIKEMYLNGELQAEYTYSGKDTSIKQKNGLETKYVYNNRKDLVQIEETDTVTGVRRISKIIYDGRHKPIKVFLGDGNTETLLREYAYYPAGEKKAEVLYGADKNRFTRYDYNGASYLKVTQFTLPVTIEVDLSDIDTLCRKSLDAVISESEALYDGSGNLSYIQRNGVNSETTLKYDPFGNLIKTVNALGNETVNKYYRNGFIYEQQSDFGGIYEYVYDIEGNLSAAGEKGKVKAYCEYYPDGSIKRTANRYGDVTEYIYNPDGSVKCVLGNNSKVWYDYDSEGRVVQQIVGKSNDILSSERYITYTYSSDGRTVTENRGGLVETTYHIDAFGNVTEAVDGKGNVQKFAYDCNGNAVESIDAYGNKSEYNYNALGQIIKVKSPAGAEIEYDYDVFGNVTKITDGEGVSWSGKYDKAGRLIEEKGRPGVEHSYSYDELGRITHVYNHGVLSERYDYSENGCRIIFTDAKGASYLYEKDKFGRLISETNRLGLKQEYFYDEEGIQNRSISFNGSETLVTYENNRLRQVTSFSDGAKDIVEYDMAGNVVLAQNKASKVLYEYNKAGLLFRQYDYKTLEEVRYEYDRTGNRIKMFSANRETSYWYGKNNELIEIFDNKTRMGVRFEYDSEGKEISRKFENGNVQTTSYDKAGREVLIIQKDNRGSVLFAEGYVYDEYGRRKATVNHNAQVTLFDYDDMSRVSKVVYPFTKSLEDKQRSEGKKYGLVTEDIEYSKNVFLSTKQINEIRPLLFRMVPSWESKLSVIQVVSEEEFEYDLNGNLISKTLPCGRIEYTYNDENQLICAGPYGGNAVVHYTYDANGNLIAENSAEETKLYQYNAQNRMSLSSVINVSSRTYTETVYGYDVFGRRVVTKDDGNTALGTMYDGFSFDIVKESPLMGNGFFTDSGETGILYGRTGKATGERWRYVTDADDKGEALRYRYIEDGTYTGKSERYIGERTVLYAGGTAIGVKSEGRSHYLGSDVQGSTKTITGDEGYVENEYSYDVFGAVVSGSFTDGVEFAYCGKIYDPVTGNLNYGFRDYAPAVARFTTVDPARDGSNWFVYCNGDAVNYTDLWGLTSSDSTINGSLVEEDNPYYDLNFGEPLEIIEMPYTSKILTVTGGPNKCNNNSDNLTTYYYTPSNNSQYYDSNGNLVLVGYAMPKTWEIVGDALSTASFFLNCANAGCTMAGQISVAESCGIAAAVCDIGATICYFAGGCTNKGYTSLIGVGLDLLPYAAYSVKPALNASYNQAAKRFINPATGRFITNTAGKQKLLVAPSLGMTYYIGSNVYSTWE